ncbi:MAG: FtsW/RodA/SpoVE family cell cycle protein, partial [Gaiellaceae bacterium]
PMSYLERQGTYAVIGVAGMIVASRWKYTRLRALAPSLVAIALLGCAAVLVVAQPINGARRWVSFGPATFQPSEVAKLAFTVWLAAHLAKRKPPRTLHELWRPVGALLGVFLILILLEPDLGTAITLAVMAGAMLFASGTRGRTLGSGFALLAILGLVVIMSKAYMRARVFSFLDPWQDAQGAGFQIVQAQIGLGSGHFLGEGLGQGVQKIHYLPEAHTDMIFAVIGEELGLVGTASVIFAYVLFAWAGLKTALECRDPFGKRLAAGLTALVCCQAGINLAAVLGLAPLTGIPLPFVSYGGSSLVVELVSVGILLNIAGHGARAASQVPDRGRGDGRTRAAGTGGGGRAEEARRPRDVRRVAGSRRSAARS